MVSKIITPHDRFFKSIMSDSRVVKDFFARILPTYIKSVINFETITAQKDSFVDDRLRLQLTDLLFAAEFNGQRGYLYLLLETQSTPDLFMPLRLLKYTIAIMEHHVHKTGESKLPLVYPMVFYSGRKKYNYSNDIFDLFKNDKKLALKTLFKPFQLLDLSKITDTELKEYFMRGVAMRVMKHIYIKDFLSILRALVDDLKVIEKNAEWSYIYKILSYIVEAGEIADKREFVKILTIGLTTFNEGKVMTLAEQWKQEGRQEGRQEGMQEGKQEGQAEAFKAVALRLFNQGMSINQVASITGISTLELKKLAQ